MILTCVRHTKQTGSFRNFGITLSQTHSTREKQPSSSPPTMAAEQHSPAHGAATEPRSKGQMKYGLPSSGRIPRKPTHQSKASIIRSEERREGKEGVSTCRYRW